MGVKLKVVAFPGCGKEDCEFCQGEKLVTKESTSPQLVKVFRQLSMLASSANYTASYDEQGMYYFVRKALEKYFRHLEEREVYVYQDLPSQALIGTSTYKLYDPIFVVYREHGHLECYIVERN